MEEGWYLMSASDLEIELARERGEETHRRSNALRLTVADALAFRNAGNVPDEHDRSLRLVLKIDTASDFNSLHSRRLHFEPDYHAAPTWRRPGSRPVNVVPLRAPDLSGTPETWLDDPAMADLERRWQETGTVAGMVVPAEYRSFVYKTVVALRHVGVEVTPDAVADSVSRWLPEHAEEIRASLKQAGGKQPAGGRFPWPELALIGIAAIWGATFVLVKDAIAEIPVLTFLAYRFVWAGLLVAVIFRRDLLRLSHDGWLAGVVMGVFLTLGYVLQTFGLRLTSPASAGFITGMFVVLTPVFAAVFLRQRAGRVAWMAALVSALGLYLMTGTGNEVHVAGDLLVFGCAAAFAFHILATDRAASHHSIGALLAVQLWVCGVVCLTFAGLGRQLVVPMGWTVWVALIVCAVFASALGFFVQTYAQRHAPPARTALILASEPAFAGFFAWLLTGQTLSLMGWLGAALIMLSIVSVELVPYLRPPQPLPQR